MKKKHLIVPVVLALTALLACGIWKGSQLVYRAYKQLDLRFAQILNKSEQTRSDLLSAIVGEKLYYDFDYAWACGDAGFIAHACGGIDGQSYTNSREAFEQNYLLGHRIFEIDFTLTEEALMVAAHDAATWRSLADLPDNAPLSNDSFAATKLCGKYTSMDVREVVELMAAYPDVCFITDTKYTDKASVLLQFAQLVKYAQSTHPETLERIIPQIYNEEMYTYVMELYPFKSMIYTLYATDWTPESVYSFCKKTGIRFVTMPAEDADADTIEFWNRLGIHSAVHTVNDREQARRLMDMGVDMIYTDFLLPEKAP